MRTLFSCDNLFVFKSEVMATSATLNYVPPLSSLSITLEKSLVLAKSFLRHSKTFRLKLKNKAENERSRIFGPAPHFTTEWRREVDHGTSRLPITSYLEEEALVIHN